MVWSTTRTYHSIGWSTYLSYLPPCCSPRLLSGLFPSPVLHMYFQVSCKRKKYLYFKLLCEIQVFMWVWCDVPSLDCFIPIWLVVVEKYSPLNHLLKVVLLLLTICLSGITISLCFPIYRDPHWHAQLLTIKNKKKLGGKKMKIYDQLYWVQEGQNGRDSSLCLSSHIIEYNYKSIYLSFHLFHWITFNQWVASKASQIPSRQLKKWRTRIRVGLGWWLLCQGRKCFDDTTQS